MKKNGLFFLIIFMILSVNNIHLTAQNKAAKVIEATPVEIQVATQKKAAPIKRVVNATETRTLNTNPNLITPLRPASAPAKAKKGNLRQVSSPGFTMTAAYLDNHIAITEKSIQEIQSRPNPGEKERLMLAKLEKALERAKIQRMLLSE